MLGSGFRRTTQAISAANDSRDFEAAGVSANLETGTILRERREAMGVSLAEVEAATRIRQKYLAAMESDEWHVLPGEIVGRGFLRNYAAYLDLEPSEMLERRRSALEPKLAAALRKTSAGAPLPPTREVNYVPKELDLKDEPEGINRPPLNLRRFLPFMLLILSAYVLWRGVDLIQGVVSSIGSGLQAQIEEFQATPESTAVNAGVVIVDLTPEGLGQELSTPSSGAFEENAPNQIDPSPGDSAQQNPVQSEVPVTSPSPTPEPELPTPVPEPPTPVPETPTPVPEPPTPIPEPPTPVPEPPTPEPLVVAPVCPDSRAIISTPGEGEVLSGAVEITGSATHESFQFYKLEYAPGTNASDGWAYFDGGNSPVAQGRLGSLDTRSFANGAYSIRLVVVDLTANFPPPCQVSVTIQN